MNKISKDRVLAALVRTFFKYFLTGMMEGKDLNDTKAVKQRLLEYYEHISKINLSTMQWWKNISDISCFYWREDWPQQKRPTATHLVQKLALWMRNLPSTSSTAWLKMPMPKPVNSDSFFSFQA